MQSPCWSLRAAIQAWEYQAFWFCCGSGRRWLITSFFFTAINPLAYVFAALFLAAAVVFFWFGVAHRELQYSVTPGWRKWAGLCLLLFALAVYPAWTFFAGHRYSAFPTFGLPCPTTLFTIGVLAFLVKPYPRGTFVVPVLWCFVGSQAAVLFDVPADLGLLVAGVVGIALLAVARPRKLSL